MLLSPSLLLRSPQLHVLYFFHEFLLLFLFSITSLYIILNELWKASHFPSYVHPSSSPIILHLLVLLTMRASWVRDRTMSSENNSVLSIVPTDFSVLLPADHLSLLKGSLSIHRFSISG